MRKIGAAACSTRASRRSARAYRNLSTDVAIHLGDYSTTAVHCARSRPQGDGGSLGLTPEGGNAVELLGLRQLGDAHSAIPFEGDGFGSDSRQAAHLTRVCNDWSRLMTHAPILFRGQRPSPEPLHGRNELEARPCRTANPHPWESPFVVVSSSCSISMDSRMALAMDMAWSLR